MLAQQKESAAKEGEAWHRRLAVGAALVLLAVFTLFPRFETGFTTWDDAVMGLLPVQAGGAKEAAWSLAVVSGRFSFIFVMPLVFALAKTYFFHPVLYYAISIGSILLNVLLFALLIRRLLHSGYAALLGAAFALAFLQNHWHHSLLTSFPGFPHLGVSCLSLAFLLLLRWKETRRRVFAITAALAFLVAIILSEAFVAYFPVLAGVLIMRTDAEGTSSLSSRWKYSSTGVTCIAIALVGYLAGYFAFRFYHPSQHFGNQFAAFSLPRIGAVIWQYTSSTIPGYFYFRDPAAVNATFDGFVPHLSRVLDRCQPEWLAKAVIIAGLSWAVLMEKRHMFTARSFRLSLLGGIACLVAPVLFVALSRQYQDWVINGQSLAYGLPSYGAYFGIIFLIVVVLLYLNQILIRWRLLWLSFVVAVCVFVAGGSFATDYYNYYINLDQKLSDLKWRVMLKFTRTEEFRQVDDGSVLYAPSLWRARGIVANGDTYWSNYFQLVTKKKILVARNAAQLKDILTTGEGRNVYFLRFEQEPKEPNQFLVFGRLEENTVPGQERIYSRELTFFSYSKNRKFIIIGSCREGDAAPRVEVNNQPVALQGNVFFAPINETGDSLEFPAVKIRSSSPVEVDSLVISYFPASQQP